VSLFFDFERRAALKTPFVVMLYLITALGLGAQSFNPERQARRPRSPVRRRRAQARREMFRDRRGKARIRLPGILVRLNRFRPRCCFSTSGPPFP
jgi:hypothetical protein